MSKITIKDTPVNISSEQVYYMSSSGEKKLLGRVDKHILPEENLSNYLFYSALEPDSKPVTLARNTSPSAKYTLVNPYDTLEFLINDGWVIVDQFISGRGVVIKTILHHPDYILEDKENLFNWDESLELTRYNSSLVNDILTPALEVTTSLKYGKIAVSYTAGYFRSFCQNGLVSGLFKLPSLRLNSIQFSVDTILEFYDNPNVKKYLLADTLQKGFKVCSGETLNNYWLMLSSLEQKRKEDRLDEIGYISNSISTIISTSSLPIWFLEGLLDNLYLLSEARLGSDVYLIDLLNAITNTVSNYRARTGKSYGVFSVLDSGHTIISSMLDTLILADYFRS